MGSSTASSPRKTVFVICGVLLLLLAGAFFVLRQRSAGSAHGISLGPIGKPRKVPVPACVPAQHPPVAPLKLAEMQARQLMNDQRFDEALSLYQDIAVSDPAFPGLNLDRSVVLLQAGQVEQSNKAIEAQLATSSCLNSLTPEQLETYCHSEMPGMLLAACQQQVSGMLRTAHLQAALVQMQLGRGPGAGSPGTAPEMPVSLPTAPLPRPARALSAASGSSVPPRPISSARVDTGSAATLRATGTSSGASAGRSVASVPSGETPPAAPRPARSRDRSLSTGADTDAAFGAYSK